MAQHKWVIGNWKMNGNRQEAGALVSALRQVPVAAGVQIVVCPPFTLLELVATQLKGSQMALGAQDCHSAEKGAFTGDISAMLLKDAGCSYVIVGHSERRQLHEEDNSLVQAKANAALMAGLHVILCIGESEQERKNGKTNAVLKQQLEGSIPASATPERVIVAYEPVWAIGSGRTPSLEEITQTHQAIRGSVAELKGWNTEKLHVIYGGSVKASNATDILHASSVDGVLVGGASLVAAEFAAIVKAAGQT